MHTLYKGFAIWPQIDTAVITSVRQYCEITNRKGITVAEGEYSSYRDGAIAKAKKVIDDAIKAGHADEWQAKESE